MTITKLQAVLLVLAVALLGCAAACAPGLVYDMMYLHKARAYEEFMVKARQQQQQQQQAPTPTPTPSPPLPK